MKRLILAMALVGISALATVSPRYAYFHMTLTGTPRVKLVAEPTDVYASVAELLLGLIGAAVAVVLIESAKFVLAEGAVARRYFGVLFVFQAVMVVEALRYNVPDWFAWGLSYVLGRENFGVSSPPSAAPVFVATVAALASLPILYRLDPSSARK